MNATPQYPNAWCRLQRVGQTFTIYRSDDGTNWLEMGATTWGVDDQTLTPMPATVYVGMEFTPENGNVSAGLQGMFVAKYRGGRRSKYRIEDPTGDLAAILSASARASLYAVSLENTW